MSDPGESEPDRLLDVELPTAFRGLDPDAVHALLEEAVERLRSAQHREQELQAAVAELEAELAEARADPTAELDEAKRVGREMVIEAQTVRRRILEDLARRRRSLRRQIEQLRAGRERLLEAYEVVGHTVEEATEELNVALPAARAAAERAGRRLTPEDTVEDLEEEIEAARLADLPIMDPPTDAERAAALSEVEPVVAAFEEVRVLGPVEAPVEDEPVVEAPEADGAAEITEDDVVEEAEDDGEPPEPEAGAEDAHAEVEPEAAVEEPEPEPDPAADTESEPAEVLQLFDRLRTESDEPEPATDAEEDEEVVEEDPVAVLADDLSRRLRRSLADEQNQVLDRLRQDRKGELELDDLLGDVDVLVNHLATAIEPRLAEAGGGEAGAPELAARLAAVVVDGVRADVEARLARATDPDDRARPVREAFREWRTDRILPLAEGVAAEALGRG